MNAEIRRHLDEALDGRHACGREACPVGAEGFARLTARLEQVSAEAWEEVLAAAQTSALCDEHCPACDGFIAILNDLTFQEGVRPAL